MSVFPPPFEVSVAETLLLPLESLISTAAPAAVVAVAAAAFGAVLRQPMRL